MPGREKPRTRAASLCPPHGSEPRRRGGRRRRGRQPPSVVRVAEGLAALAELAPARARGRLAGGERALLGGGLVGPDRPAHARRAGFRIIGGREAFAREG